MKRAPLKGEESMNAANAIIECEKALQKIAQDAQKQQEFDLELDEE